MPECTSLPVLKIYHFGLAKTQYLDLVITVKSNFMERKGLCPALKMLGQEPGGYAEVKTRGITVICLLEFGY